MEDSLSGVSTYDLAADYESGTVVYRWQCRRCNSGRGHAPRADLAIQAAEVHAISHVNDDDRVLSDVWHAIGAVLVVLVAALVLLATAVLTNPVF